jgi:hypothetical protein
MLSTAPSSLHFSGPNWQSGVTFDAPANFRISPVCHQKLNCAPILARSISLGETSPSIAHSILAFDVFEIRIVATGVSTVLTTTTQCLFETPFLSAERSWDSRFVTFAIDGL